MGVSDSGALWLENPDETLQNPYDPLLPRVYLAGAPPQLVFGSSASSVYFFEAHEFVASGGWFALGYQDPSGTLLGHTIGGVHGCEGDYFTLMAMDESRLYGFDLVFGVHAGGPVSTKGFTRPIGDDYCPGAHAPLNNKIEEPRYNLSGWATAIAVDDTRLYAFVSDDPTWSAFSIRSVPKDTTGAAWTVIGEGADEEWLVGDMTLRARHGTLIWAGLQSDWTQHRIGMLDPGGTPRTLVDDPDVIAHGAPYFHNDLPIALDGYYAYWTTETGFVKRVRLCSGTPEILASNQDQPVAIAVDDNAVYWLDHGTQPGTGTVMRMRKLDAPGYPDASTDAGISDASPGDADAGD